MTSWGDGKKGFFVSAGVKPPLRRWIACFVLWLPGLVLVLGLLHPATGFAQAVCGNNVIDPNEGCIDGSFVMGVFKATSQFKPSGEGASRITIRGFLDAHPPLDGFQASLEEGLDPNSDSPDEIVMLITVDDGADFRLVLAFSRSECRLRIKGPFLSKVLCKSADKSKKAVFRNVPFAPDVYKYAIRGKRLSIQPFLRDEVSAVLTVGTVDRPDVIGDVESCRIRSGSMKDRLKCIEPGS